MAGLFFAEENWNLLAVLGVLWVAVLVIRGVGQFVSFLQAYVLSPVFGVGRADLTGYGSWAVVTGASDGIGRGYALELARRGLNVVIMSRSQEKLQKVANTIEERHKKKVLVMPIDFSSGLEVYHEISQQLQELDVGILVNNVGAFYGIPDRVGGVAPKALNNVTHLNTHPVVQMSRLMVPRMLQKKKGLIINISSSASGSAAPRMTVYSATKIFTNYVSEGLEKEYGNSGIHIQNVVPYFVSTPMTGKVKASFFIPDAERFARSAVATIGIQQHTRGYFAHAIQGYINSWLPGFVKEWITWRITGVARKRFAMEKKKAQSQ